MYASGRPVVAGWGAARSRTRATAQPTCYGSHRLHRAGTARCCPGSPALLRRAVARLSPMAGLARRVMIGSHRHGPGDRTRPCDRPEVRPPARAPSLCVSLISPIRIACLRTNTSHPPDLVGRHTRSSRPRQYARTLRSALAPVRPGRWRAWRALLTMSGDRLMGRGPFCIAGLRRGSRRCRVCPS